MNAILQEYEAAVLTNETIEAHLSYLQPAVEALAGKIDRIDEKLNEKLDQANRDRAAGDAMLADKIDKVDEKLSEKLDQANRDRIAGDAMLADKIDKVDEKLSEKLDHANKDRAAGDAKLAEKLDRANDRIAKVQGSIDGLKWFIASIAVIVSGVSLAHTFGWM